jgi:large subunit ribosomal protein L22
MAQIQEGNGGHITAVAKLRGCSMSARKMRLVADIVRGVTAEKALGILKFTRKEAAVWVHKLLNSAISNWKVKTGAEPEEHALVLKAIWVDQAPQLKRFQPAPHGRAHRIRKHYCHVTLEVSNTLAVAAQDANVQEADTVDAETTVVDNNQA